MELKPKKDVTKTRLRKTASAPVNPISGEEMATAAQTIALMSGMVGGWDVYFRYPFVRSEGHAILFLGAMSDMSQEAAVSAARERWPRHTRLFIVHRSPRKVSANDLNQSEEVYSPPKVSKVLTEDQTREMVENANRIVNTVAVDPNEPEPVED